MPTWDQIREAIVTTWQKLPLAVQFALVFVVVGLVVWGVVWMGTAPEYVILLSNLTLEDAGAVASKLTQLNHKYELAGDGTTIKVLAKDVRQIRIQLASEGVPKTGSNKGFELFDEAPLGMTPFTQQVNLGRALQAELARSIQQIAGVASARVHIVRPESSVFVRDRTPTTASVILKLRPGFTLGRANAAAIVAMVSHAVENLAPERVTLVDANSGRILSEQRGPDGMSGSTHLDYRVGLEQHLTSQVENMLTQALGPGRAIVTVAADINFKKSREKREIINPEERVVAMEKITTKREQPAAPKAGGTTGATVNLKSPGGGFNLDGGGRSSNEETIENEYRFSKTFREIEDAYGTIERLSVAAMVDIPKAEGDGDTPLTQEKIEALIKSAVGFNAQRGDKVDVTPTKLAAAAALVRAEAEAVTQETWDYYVTLVRNGSLGVASVMALLLGWLFLRRLRPAPTPAPVLAPAPPPPPSAVTQLAERDPEALARYLAQWLREAEPPPGQSAA